MQSADEESDKIPTYERLVSMFGLKNINATVWLINEDEPDHPPSNTMKHTEF
jgi:hypothetical protein